MLSVLVPIYNFDSRKLVSQLVNQCDKQKILFEINAGDALTLAQLEKFKLINRSMIGHYGVSYIEMPENYGRAKIRNKLAQNARFENLLFLDCDSKIGHKSFIKKYLTHLNAADVIAGGRKYRNTKPKNKKLQLLYRQYILSKYLPFLFQTV